MRHGSWYTRSNLNFMEVLYLTYDIVRRVPALSIQQEDHFGTHTISECAQFCSDVMLDYVEGCSQKIGGPNKTVAIDQEQVRPAQI
jgi:hypothetical protein